MIDLDFFTRAILALNLPQCFEQLQSNEADKSELLMMIDKEVNEVIKTKQLESDHVD